MASNEKKRESLMVEATAYTRRTLLSFNELSFRGKEILELFAGQRSDGRWSLYFDEAPVIQFDETGGLRRVYIDGVKLVASESQLVELVRHWRGGRVEHTKQLWTAQAQLQLLEELRLLLERTYQQLMHSDQAAGKFNIESAEPSLDSQKIFSDLISFLERQSQHLKIAGGH
jgi:hypothetical protein